MPTYELLILILSVVACLRAESKYTQELVLCRACGADVADGAYLRERRSPSARRFERRPLFGEQNLTVQTLLNPFGIQFSVVTIEKARCSNIGPRQSAESWFPGYTWRVCACPSCGQHLGWTFEGEADKFHGLIVSNVLGENFTDSLLMIPKMYRL